MSNALIIVDFQYDFILGSLATNPSWRVKKTIARAGEEFADHVVFTRDWHPADHFSFSDAPEFKDGSWPSHCVQDTTGAQIDPDLLETFRNAPIFSKGQDKNVEAYSGFDGKDPNGRDLDLWLQEHEVDSVLITGIATDYCVRATAISAAEYDYNTVVLVDGVQGVDPQTSLIAACDMGNYRVRFDTLDGLIETGF